MPVPIFYDTYNLVKVAGVVSEKDLEDAQKTAIHLAVPLHDVLIGRKLIAKDVIGNLIAKSMGIGYVDIKRASIPKETLQTVKEELARERKAIPFERVNGTLHLAMEDPKDLESINFIRKVTNLNIVPFLTFEKDIKFGLHQYKSSLADTFGRLLEQARKRHGHISLQELAEDVSVIEAVNQMLEYSVIQEASDVHIEALVDAVLVRYRIDGVLHDMITLPKDLHAAIVARIKILATLKLDESRLPQDGRFKFESEEGDVVSLRVSVLPTVEGEKVVLRLLESGAPSFSLEDLGYDADSVTKIKQVLTRPHGLVLLTGPTGSGKTTSLYTMLNMLNTGEVNISTVEDPVENRIRRINQTQINSQINFTFAEGLRSLLRQDPDIVMVGEIRDADTAGISTNAAMTGHLVLSTLHTNDASGAIPRLIDLGAEPFLVASTLELVIAQRLVRKLCTRCAVARPTDPNVVTYMVESLTDQAEKDNLRKIIPGETKTAPGCNFCSYTGFSGRTGVYELFTVNDEIRQLILERATAIRIKAVALKNGMHTMLVDGAMKVASGVTTIEEVLRVTFD